MVTKRCSWGQCNSDNRYNHKPHMNGVTFFPFPKPSKDLDRCKAWIKACGRPHEQLNAKKIGRHHFVCSKHFENGEPTKSQPDPCDAVPYSGSRSTKKRPAPKERLPSMPVNKMQKTLFVDQTVTEEPSTSTASLGEVTSSDDEPETEKGTQTSPQKVCGEHHGQGFFAFKSKVKCSNCGYYTVPSKEEIKHISKGSFIQTIQKNDATCFHYTGVPKVAFLLQLFIWLEPLASKIKLWDGQKKFDTSGHSAARKRRALTSFEEFCLTLVRIRRGYDVVLLSHLFGISKSHVCRILPSLINFLAKCLKPLIKWPSKDVVKANLPHAFKRYPRTRVIIDCTKIYVEKAFRPAAQRATWSSYKHANTFKLLVGIMPSDGAP